VAASGKQWVLEIHGWQGTAVFFSAILIKLL
jgi:hypothetical protein